MKYIEVEKWVADMHEGKVRLITLMFDGDDTYTDDNPYTWDGHQYYYNDDEVFDTRLEALRHFSHLLEDQIKRDQRMLAEVLDDMLREEHND